MLWEASIPAGITLVQLDPEEEEEQEFSSMGWARAWIEDGSLQHRKAHIVRDVIVIFR